LMRGTLPSNPKSAIQNLKSFGPPATAGGSDPSQNGAHL
jgi:hypothetical protein